MIWWIAATLCAFYVKGLCGFANTLVFTTVMSFGLSNRNISPVELLLGYPSNAIIALKERRSIDPKLCLALAALVVLGSIPGVLCGLYGVGALLGAYVSRVARDARAFRANLCVVFFVENTLRIILYSAMGLLNMGMLLQAARLFPAALLGLFLGMKSGAYVSEKAVRRIVIVMLIVSGLSLVIGQLG